MAAADYHLCRVCCSKVFYDSEVNYNVPSFGDVLAICESCYQEGYRIIVLAPIQESPMRQSVEHCRKREKGDPNP